MALTPFRTSLVDQACKVGLSVWKGFKTMSSDPKFPRILKVIGTHGGVFHCDEALACFMLKQLPEYQDAEIRRTRDMGILDTCDIVVDVGGVYDPERNRFDHHQRDFNHTLSTVLPHIKNKNIKLSSAGLIYAHFGMQVISEVLKNQNFQPDTDCLQAVFLAVYDGFIEEVDAIDNGVPMYSEGMPKYRINTHLSARIHRLNPEWNYPDEPTDKLFVKAMELVGAEFLEKVSESAKVWWPAREIVKCAIKTRLITHESGAIIQLNERCPWKDHLMQLEEELGMKGELKFVIFHDSTDSWRVQGIPIQPDSFVCRVFLHSKWRGVRDEELSTVSGIPGCIFCHATGFIGGNKTREGALRMAIESLKAAKLENGE
ncbi:MYG1 protein isoform X2 [Atheta coriaria]|uniref:MYG1 protein isoform X2 n=1 Tax=Dalotia coriaria TaxID=877792 RepID=UPI0031F3BF0D